MHFSDFSKDIVLKFKMKAVVKYCVYLDILRGPGPLMRQHVYLFMKTPQITRFARLLLGGQPAKFVDCMIAIVLACMSWFMLKSEELDAPSAKSLGLLQHVTAGGMVARPFDRTQGAVCGGRMLPTRGYRS